MICWDRRNEVFGMALGLRFVCDPCGHAIDAWDEGNPYYFDENGTKRYAYQPCRERDLCIGVESPHLWRSLFSSTRQASWPPATTKEKLDFP